MSILGIKGHATPIIGFTIRTQSNGYRPQLPRELSTRLDVSASKIELRLHDRSCLVNTKKVANGDMRNYERCFNSNLAVDAKYLTMSGNSVLYVLMTTQSVKLPLEYPFEIPGERTANWC